MPNDFFDQHLKKQLESINSPPRSDIWQRVKTHLPQPWYVSFWKDWGTMLVGGMVSTGLFLNFWMQLKTKQSLENLENENQKMKSEIKEIKTKTLHRVDTLYIIKEVKHYYQNQNLQNGINSTPTFEIQKEKRLNEFLEQLQNTKNELKKEFEALQKLKQGDVLVKEVIKDETFPRIDLDIIPGLRNHFLSIFPREYYVLPFAVEIPFKKKKKSLSVFRTMPPLRLGAGINFDGNFSLSGGIELFLLPNFSLSAGIQSRKYSSIEFNSLNEFETVTGVSFERAYPEKIPSPKDPEKFEMIVDDIEIHRNILQIPLSLTYYFPLGKGYSLFLNTASQIDLSVTETLKFETKQKRRKDFSNPPPQQEDENGQYTVMVEKKDPNAFYNLDFGFGIQKRFGVILGQFLPYFTFNIGNKDSFRTNPVFGVKTSFLLNLSRKR